MTRYMVALTGHRLQDLSPTQRELASVEMETILSGYKEAHPDLLVLSGMATGVDQIGAQVCVDLGIDFTACLPYERYFNTYPGARNNELLAQAFKVRYVCEGKWHYTMNFRRNLYMLKWADVVLACAKFSSRNVPTRGGTAHMVRETLKANKPLVLVNLVTGVIEHPQDVLDNKEE